MTDKNEELDSGLPAWIKKLRTAYIEEFGLLADKTIQKTTQSNNSTITQAKAITTSEKIVIQ